jgi:hypothetical protein
MKVQRDSMKTNRTVRAVLLSGVLCLCSWAAPSFAQPAGPPAAAPKPDPAAAAAAVQEIGQDLISPDTSTQEKGIAGLKKLMDSEPLRAAPLLRERSIKALMDTQHYQEIDELCLKAILAAPSDTASVETLQLARLRANLAAGKPERAVQQAKGLYNVSSMATTNAAMLVMAECLNAAFPEDLGVVERFETQQVAGANPPATQPSAGPAAPPQHVVVAANPATHPSTSAVRLADPGDPVLAGIKVDDSDYRDTIAKTISEDTLSLIGKGNLLLLADRARDAKGVFERAYSEALDAQLPLTSEAIARQMKAQDGTIWRANQWILSIRPKPLGKAG